MRNDSRIHNDASREAEQDEKAPLQQEVLPRSSGREVSCVKCAEYEAERIATIDFLHDLETELIEGRPEIALESIRGAIKIQERIR